MLYYDIDKLIKRLNQIKSDGIKYVDIYLTDASVEFEGIDDYSESDEAISEVAVSYDPVEAEEPS